MAFFVGVDAVVAEVFRVVLLLKESGSDVDHGDVVFDGCLENFDVVSLVPVRYVLTVVLHPLQYVLFRQSP